MELAIDTSSDVASLALSSRGEVVEGLVWHSGRNHTVELMPNLIHLSKCARVSAQDLSAIVVTSGPGTFNGLRVGMSFAKGLAFALGIPIVGMGTLEAEAFRHAGTGLPVCPVLDMGRDEVAAAVFQSKEGRWGRLVDEHITTVEGLLARIDGPTVFCGGILPEIASRLRRKVGSDARLPGDGEAMARASSVAQLGWRRLSEGEVDDLATLQPMYLRKPSVTVSRRRPLSPRA